MTLVVFLSGCSRDSYNPAHDYFSFANSEQFITHHLELDLAVDFSEQSLKGYAILHMERLDQAAQTLVLDSRGLQISAIELALAGGEFRPVTYRVDGADPVLGEAIRIQLPGNFKDDSEFKVRIDYQTGPNASALMWLPPALTLGGDYPFMFTQSQSIHARSWVPLQDTPAVRFTYEAKISTPPQLLALMSANNEPEAERSGDYRFSMPQPIPSYLLALAVGNLFFEPLGEDTGVYAEPGILQDAAWEFADTQDRKSVV